jgi:hypothetical protein
MRDLNTLLSSIKELSDKKNQQMYQRNKQTQGRNGLNMFISIPPYSS